MAWDRRYEVYVIRCSGSSLQFFGMASNGLKIQWRSHRSQARRGVRHPLYDTMRQLGEDRFTIELVRGNLDEHTARGLKASKIKKLNTVWPNGFNLCSPAGRHARGTYTGLNSPPLQAPLTRKEAQILQFALGHLSACG